MLAVTTFPQWGWDVYAKHCIETWLEFWPGSIRAYYEGDAPPSLSGVEFRPLDNIEARTKFLDLPVQEPPSYLHDVKRFCHKVFAQLDAVADNDQFWWLDSDVELRCEPPRDLIESLLTRSFVSFLGRDTYTETGVIAFNGYGVGFDDFEERYRACYEEQEIFTLRFWTDCHAFDYARRGGGHNITPHGHGVENVLRSSILGPFMEHHKGNLKMKLGA